MHLLFCNGIRANDHPDLFQHLVPDRGARWLHGPAAGRVLPAPAHPLLQNHRELREAEGGVQPFRAQEKNLGSDSFADASQLILDTFF